MSLIAFYSERSGSGKDTAADFAADYLRAQGIEVVRDAFAWDGKIVCADALGIEGTRMEKIAAIDRLKLHGNVAHYDGLYEGRTAVVDGRDFIIGLLGSPDKGNGVRGLDEGFWTGLVLDRARAVRARDGWTVISDLRFFEEARSVRQAGGWVVDIDRPDGSLGTFNEQRLPPSLIDQTLRNDGTLDDLRSKVQGYVHGLVAYAAR